MIVPFADEFSGPYAGNQLYASSFSQRQPVPRRNGVPALTFFKRALK